MRISLFFASYIQAYVARGSKSLRKDGFCKNRDVSSFEYGAASHESPLQWRHKDHIRIDIINDVASLQTLFLPPARDGAVNKIWIVFDPIQEILLLG